MYTANSKSIPASDRNQAGSVQLDAKHNSCIQIWDNIVYRVQIYLFNFNMVTAVGGDGSGTQRVEWHYSVDPTYLHFSVYLHTIKELHNNHNQLL